MSSGVGIGASFVFNERPGGASGSSFIVDKAFVFDGVDEYIAFQTSSTSTKNLIPNQTAVSSNNYTVSMWVKSSSFATQPLWGNNCIGPNGDVSAGMRISTHSTGESGGVCSSCQETQGH